MAHRQPPGHQDQRNASQNARDDAGGKQGRNRSLGHQQAVDDEGDRGRDQDAGRTGRADHTGGEGTRITGLDHRRQHHGTDRRRIGRAGTGNPAHDHRHQNRDNRQTATPLADQRRGEANNAGRHADPLENQPCNDEDRDRHQRILGDAGVAIGRQGQHAETGNRDDGGAGQAHGHRQRHTGQHQKNEDAEEQPIHHLASRHSKASRRSTINRESTGSHTVYHHCGTPSEGEVTSKR